MCIRAVGMLTCGEYWLSSILILVLKDVANVDQYMSESVDQVGLPLLL